MTLIGRQTREDARFEQEQRESSFVREESIDGDEVGLFLKTMGEKSDNFSAMKFSQSLR